MTASTATSLLLARIRDPNGVGTSRSLARTVLSYCQQIVALRLQAVIATATFTTALRQVVYATTAIALDVGRIEALRDDTALVPKVAWRELARADRQWFRRTGPSVQCWAPIGRELFVVYPAPDLPVTLTAHYTTITQALLSETTPLDVADIYLSPILDLAESVLLLRNRLFLSSGVAFQHAPVHLNQAETL